VLALTRALLEGRLKRRWHDELVADDATHAWVLNLYRAGERHPVTVDDYFPVEHAPAWLAPRMAQHRDEEARHDRIYAGAIAKLGQPLVEYTGLDVFNVAIRAHTDAVFRIVDSDSAQERTAKLAHFLAHAHFLEARIATSLEMHVDACERAGKHDVARAVGIVLDDEREHARYTLDAVHRLLPSSAAAQAVLDVHRRGEARANLAFSARQVRAHLARKHDAIWHVCALAMEQAVARV